MDSFTDSYTQDNRLLSLSSPLGGDVLLLESVTGSEAICDFFHFHLKVRSKRTDLKAADLVGKSVDIALQIDDSSPPRIWNGIVTRCHAGLEDGRGLRAYDLTIRPFLWFLTQTSDCRIKHGKTSQDITMEYFGERGFKNVRFQLVGTLPVRDYSVQYNESAFAYLARLWEEDGLFWWFEHEAGKHTLVITNTVAAYSDAPNPTPSRLAIANWHEHGRFIPGLHSGDDWNFEQPQGPVGATTPSVISVANNSAYEVYEYPGRVSNADDAQSAANLRMHALEAEHYQVSAQTIDRTLAPGLRFTPQAGEGEPEYDRYVITKIAHTAVEGTYDSSAARSYYAGSYVAIPAALPATPHRKTPRPRIDGLQMAVVFGPPKEEIFTDMFGRIQVRFPWDRRADISCWMRVVQPWAGNNWGVQVIPRVGQEVAVMFTEGDPDRPVCLGALTNPDNPPPYPLPANKTRMVVRSNSYKSRGYNELSLEDETGEEEFYIHAQKDMNVKVLNNAATRIDTNAVESVGLNKGVEIANNLTEVVGGDMQVTVGTAQGSVVPPSQTGLATGVGQSAYAMGDKGSAAMGSGNLTVLVTGNASETIQKNRTENVAQNEQITIGKASTTQIGTTWTVTAGQTITFQCGDSSIVISSDGTINIAGKTITINGSSAVNLKGGQINQN